MAVEIFKNGERKLVEPEHLYLMLHNGWQLEPGGRAQSVPEVQTTPAPPPAPVPPPAPQVPVTPQVTQPAPVMGVPGMPAATPQQPTQTGFTERDLEGMELSDIRSIARDKGIERWDTAQRNTLVKAIMDAG